MRPAVSLSVTQYAIGLPATGIPALHTAAASLPTSLIVTISGEVSILAECFNSQQNYWKTIAAIGEKISTVHGSHSQITPVDFGPNCAKIVTRPMRKITVE